MEMYVGITIGVVVGAFLGPIVSMLKIGAEAATHSLKAIQRKQDARHAKCDDTIEGFQKCCGPDDKDWCHKDHEHRNKDCPEQDLRDVEESSDG